MQWRPTDRQKIPTKKVLDRFGPISIGFPIRRLCNDVPSIGLVCVVGCGRRRVVGRSGLLSALVREGICIHVTIHAFRYIYITSACTCANTSTDAKPTAETTTTTKATTNANVYVHVLVYVYVYVYRCRQNFFIFFFFTHRNGINQTNDSTDEGQPCTNDPLNQEELSIYQSLSKRKTMKTDRTQQTESTDTDTKSKRQQHRQERETDKETKTE